MLLAREKSTVPGVIERLVAMQAQLPRPPYIGLWSRMAGFRRDDLTRLVLQRKVVRATSLRGTLHLMTAKDFRAMRAAIQPALTRGALAILKGRTKGIDIERVVEFARTFFAKAPATFEEVRDALAARHPKADVAHVRAMAYLVRTHLPLVQVPDDSAWGFPTSTNFALAESWLGEPLAKDSGPQPLVLRYLAAFGPATPADMQAWSGFPAPMVREAFAALAPKLIALPGERGRELFDLPKAPRPGEDTEAPVRFLPEFDNLLLSHAVRKRVIADAHRRAVYLPGLRVASTLLVDGFVAGTWAIEGNKDAATLTVQPFGALAKGVRDAVGEEGEKLVRFVEEGVARVAVRWVGRGRSA
jgi:hypothetical protein